MKTIVKGRLGVGSPAPLLLFEGVDRGNDPLQHSRCLLSAARPIPHPSLTIVVVARIAPNTQDVQVSPDGVKQATRGVPVVDQLLEAGGWSVVLARSVLVHGHEAAYHSIKPVADVALKSLMRAALAHTTHLPRQRRLSICQSVCLLEWQRWWVWRCGGGSAGRLACCLHGIFQELHQRLVRLDQLETLELTPVAEAGTSR
mmetsp:Transcript_25814/g.58683  ORF Transcript_25814/g.58683 Transcript_25814/m.58683 type:complete len:201 (+) Transcript_25814:214-816(+)